MNTEQPNAARQLLERVIKECSSKSSTCHVSLELYGKICEFLEKPEPEPVAEIIANNGEAFDVEWSVEYLDRLEAGAKLYSAPLDESARIRQLEADLALNEQLCSNYIKDQQKSLDLMVDANGVLIDNVNEQIKKIAELERQLENAVDINIDKILKMSDEQINAIQVMEGRNPDDVAKIGRMCFEIAALKQQLADLQNKKAVLLSNDQIGECYSAYSWYEFAREIEKAVLKANGIKVGE